MRFSVRFIVIFVSCLFFLTSHIATPAFAQTYPNQVNSFTTVNTNPDVPKNLHSLSQIVTTEVMATMICQLSGIDPLRTDHKCLGSDPKTGQIGFVNDGGGLLGLTERGIAFTMQPPIHTGIYTNYLADNFGFATKTYAAGVQHGVGFTGLQPLLTIWVAFRNIVYLIFIIMFIIVGLGIMLRVQIDPRTVMTIENQIPRIIISIILVTFSFAIAGIMVDMMWVLTFFVINTMQSVDTGKTLFASDATRNLLTLPYLFLSAFWEGGIWGLVGGIYHGLAAFINAAFPTFWSQHSTQISQGVNGGTCAIGSVIPFNLDWGCLFSTLFSTIIFGILETFAFLLGWLIILVIIVIAMLRLWIALLRVYIYIILDVILAPFYIVFGLIPGATFGFGSWLKGLTANLLAFPAVIFALLLARVLSDAFTSTNSLFIPPLVGNPNAGGNALGAFIAFGLLLMTPEIPNAINRTFGVEQSTLGGAAIASLVAGPRMLGNATRTIGGAGLDYFTGRNPVVPRGMGAVMRGFFGR